MNKFLIAVAVCLVVASEGYDLKVTGNDLPGCEIYSENQCDGDQIDTDPSFEDHRWYTPARGSDGWIPSFQDFSELVGFSTVQYDSTAMSGASVTVTATQKQNATLSYVFNGKEQASNVFTATSSLETLTISIKSDLGFEINLEPVDFAWTAPSVKEQHSGDYRQGQKGAIVEMFGWPHADIEKECEFLAEAGYMGVKVFPPQEHILSDEPYDSIFNPWYFMYQPVSYRMAGRMGTREELKSMIDTCRKFGVRVYADAVVNHMTGGGNDANPKHRNPNAGCQEFGSKKSSASDGYSPMYTQDYIYSSSNVTEQPASQEFPMAAYGPLDFHCEQALNSWTDPNQLNAGWLTGLTDLNTERDYVQERIAAYMSDLIGIGFSGFRVDAAKHIKPDDIVAIFTKFKRNMGGSLPSDFITWLEILLGGESDLLMCDPDSGYNYGSYLEDALLDAGFSQEDVNKIKIWNSGYPKEPDNGACTISKVRNAVQNDDADQQNPGSSSRDMGDQGCVLIKDCSDSAEHRGFETKLFDQPNGANDNDNEYPIRLILSSFWWVNDVQGIPDGKSDCDLCTINCEGCKGMKYAPAFDDSSTGYDQVDYTRPHRDSAIIKSMQAWMGIH